jgi:adenylylsulfate kinase
MREAEGVLLTGVYGSGKSSVAEEIAYLLEQRGEPYALLDLDYLSWAGTGTGDRAGEVRLMLQNMAAVAANYRRAGIRLFVLAYFVRSLSEVSGVREALGLPLRVVRLEVPLRDIERRLASDVTSGRRDDVRAATASIAAAEGAGVEDVVIGNDRPVGVVARDVLTFLGCSRPPDHGRPDVLCRGQSVASDRPSAATSTASRGSGPCGNKA